MAVTYDLKMEGPNLVVGGDNESAELVGIARGDYDSTTVWTAIAASAPTTYVSPATGRTLYRQSINLDHKALGVWEFSIPFGPREAKNAANNPPPVISFEISTETQKVTHYLEVVNSYPAGTAPDLKGAINFNGKEVEGVEVDVPTITLNFEQVVADSVIDADKIKEIARMAGKINDDTWYGFDAGELKFKGCSGTSRFENSDWKLNFSFAVSENATGIAVGPITGIVKKGWHYLWTKYKKLMDGANLVSEPEAVYVGKVLKEADYDDLPINV